jgi:hypothetical protein
LTDSNDIVHDILLTFLGLSHTGNLFCPFERVQAIGEKLQKMSIERDGFLQPLDVPLNPWITDLARAFLRRIASIFARHFRDV